MTVNSFQAPTWTSVRLQPPKHQLCLAVVLHLGAPTPNDFSLVQFWGSNLLGSNPTLVYTGMPMHSIQLRFSHSYSPASAASAASTASAASFSSVSSTISLSYSSSQQLLHKDNSLLYKDDMLNFVLLLACLTFGFLNTRSTFWLPSSSHFSFLCARSTIYACLTLWLPNAWIPLSIRVFQYSQDALNQWQELPHPDRNRHRHYFSLLNYQEHSVVYFFL